MESELCCEWLQLHSWAWQNGLSCIFRSCGVHDQCRVKKQKQNISSTTASWAHYSYWYQLATAFLLLPEHQSFSSHWHAVLVFFSVARSVVWLVSQIPLSIFWFFPYTRLDCFWFLVNILTVQCDGTFFSTSYLSCPQHCVHAVSCWWHHRTPLKLNKQEWLHHAGA